MPVFVIYVHYLYRSKNIGLISSVYFENDIIFTFFCVIKLIESSQIRTGPASSKDIPWYCTRQ